MFEFCIFNMNRFKLYLDFYFCMILIINDVKIMGIYLIKKFDNFN